LLIFEPIKVKHYTKAVKLHTNSIYLLGLYLQNEDEDRNVFCIHIHVTHIEVSCLMVEINNYYLKWRRIVLGISANEKQVLWFDYVAYIGNILEIRVGAMVEDGLAFQQCGLSSK